MRRSIFLIIALWLAVLPAHAASPAETRAYGIAGNAFRAGLWDRADRELSSFIAKYPNSTNTPEAILLQAQARVQLGRLAEATDLLATNWTAAGGLADEYLFWTAEIYYQRTNYSNASKIFARLATEFPQSSHRLEAALGEAASEAELQHWSQVVGLLDNPNGVFQLTASPNGTNEVIFRGGLLLAQAQLAQQNFHPAEAVLTDLAEWRVSRALKWQRQYLLSRVQLADERPEDALRSANDLVALADTAELRAQSVEMRALILQHLQRDDEAIVAYRQNLAADIPVVHQQQALFKIAELSLSLGKVADATQQLEMFLRQNTNSPVADVVWFTLGDMQLKQYLAGIDTNEAPDIATNVAGLNFLHSAMGRFQALREKFPASSLVGQSFLHEGWCYWFSDDWAGSAISFQAAARRLPFSENQLIARFKWADSQSRLKDFVGAITNYNFVVTHAAGSGDPHVQDLAEPALYQLLRASFDAGDVRSGSDALAKILNLYPNSFIAARALFLSGQGLSLRKDTAQARDLFSEVERRFPNSPYLPEARLAIARTYEQEGKWTNAISQYDDWLATFTNNPARPRVEYYRSWANFQSGDETNALTLFTNFVARFPTDSLAPSAQWWVADHFFREGDFPDAEKNYKAIFQNTSWMSSDLDIGARRIGYEARLMAGRAALARSGYADAFSHFTNLTSDVSCPADIWAQAVFAYGDAKMMMPDTSITNKQSNLQSAMQIFSQISPTNSLYAPTLGRIGDCYLQLAVNNPKSYDFASNTYAQVTLLPEADVATRSQAKIGLGIVAEKLAQQKTGSEQTSLLVLAFNDYNDVFLYDILRNNEKPDPFWTRLAGLNAAQTAESLGYWVQAINIYQRLEQLAPPLQPMLEKKIVAAKKNLEGTPD